ncbi:MAG TPA: TIGR00730 family Rossman fold protein, partial [Cytophagales bacterium]|nr:TIGR00730 family Rossman fold protein [Cytophagales bacterium]
GGGSIGLMGPIATAVMEAGGRAVGVIPKFLDEMEIGHTGITHLILVDSMHQRKQKMEAISEGVIAMPGGFGTLEELTEIITWAQLKLVKKPIGLLNVNGYYDPLLKFVDHMLEEGFLSEANRELLMSNPDPEALLAEMKEYHAMEGTRQMKPNQT